MLGAPLPPGSRAATSPSEHGREQPWLVWRWPAALRGATFALPGAVVVPFDARLGVALAVGVIPAAVLPLPPQRRDRLVIVVVGALMGISVLVGSLLATTPCLAVAGILVLAVAAAAVAIRRARALVLLFLALPLVGVGLSYPGLATAAPLAGLFLLGAIYGYAAAIFWPSTPKPAGTDGPPPLDGRCSATAYAWVRRGALRRHRIHPALRARRMADHGGIARDEPRGQDARAAGAGPGGLGVCGRGGDDRVPRPPPVARPPTVAVAAVVIAATATVGSRWYITPAFTTSLVFLLLLLADPTQAGERLGERMGETLLGVAVAILFGDLLPRVKLRRKTEHVSSR